MIDSYNLREGDKIDLYFGFKNRANALYHVVAVISDTEKIVVVRHWIKYKQRWDYQVLTERWFAVFSTNFQIRRKSTRLRVTK